MKFALLFSIICIVLSGCSSSEEELRQDKDIRLTLNVRGDFAALASSDVGTATHSVNRLLVIPFQKLNVSLPDSDSTNFIPAWNFVRQYDISTFPVTSIKTSLPKSFTYKVYIIGYNRNDYDYNQPGSSTNRFDITSQPASVSLANFRLYPKAPNEIPEFFSCVCTASVNGTNNGTAFTPADNSNITLSGKLQRIVSGLGVYMTNVPAFVNSITLSAENLVKATNLCNNKAGLVQTTGDGGNRVIRQLTPQSGSVRFNEFLLPTGTIYKTRFYLIVNYGTQSTQYTINVPDGEDVSSQQFILRPNNTIIINGNFSSTGISFELNYNINLDDNKWDGLQ